MGPKPAKPNNRVHTTRELTAGESSHLGKKCDLVHQQGLAVIEVSEMVYKMGYAQAIFRPMPRARVIVQCFFVNSRMHNEVTDAARVAHRSSREVSVEVPNECLMAKGHEVRRRFLAGADECSYEPATRVADSGVRCVSVRGAG